MILPAWAWVMIGGAIGAGARFYVQQHIGQIAQGIGHGFWQGFPFGTLTVNIVGAFLMGLLIAFFAGLDVHVQGDALVSALQQHWRPLLAIGMLGGFTTFSTFSLDVFVLVERAAYLQGAMYIAFSVVGSIVALMAAIYTVRFSWSMLHG